MDLIDTAILDFLIGNADRHRYETYAKAPATLLMLDNAKRYNKYNNNKNDNIIKFIGYYTAMLCRVLVLKHLLQYKKLFFSAY